MRKYIVIFLSFFFIDAVFYWNLWNTYFQQDEWFLFGRAIYQSQHLPLAFFDFAAKHFWPLGNMLWFLLYKTVAFHAGYYAFAGLILHTIAAMLVFFFLKNITKEKVGSLVMTLFFLICFPARQVIVWFVVSPFLIPCLIGILLYLLYLQKCQRKGDISLKDTTVLFLLFLLSFCFREESMMLLPLTPLYILLFFPQGKRFTAIKRIGLLLAFIFVTIIIRFAADHFFGEKVVFDRDNPIKIILYNLISIPQKLIVQNILELEDIWPIATLYTKLGFPWLIPDGISIINTVFEDVVFLFCIPIAVLAGFSLSKMKENTRSIFYFSLIWLVLATILLAAGGRRLQFLESRYLYVSSIGTLLFFYAIVKAMWNEKGLKRIIIRCSTILALLSLVIYSFIGIQSRIEKIYVPLALERESILTQIVKMYPTIPRHAIFYATCKNPQDCIVNPLVIPFQSGVGQMLMVEYGSKNEKAYAPFFKDFYLWDWESEGYKEIGDYGFGYFREFPKLQAAYAQGKILPEEVFAFSYDKQKNKITDISPYIRQKLIKEFLKQTY